MFFEKKVDSNIVLNMVKLEDAEEIFSLVDTSRDYLRKWLPWVDSNTTGKDTEKFIVSARQQSAANNGFQCCIRYKLKIAGIVGFYYIDQWSEQAPSFYGGVISDWESRTTELAYWLAQKYQGMGLMTKCCNLLTDYAFQDLDLHRVEILPNNSKSCAIPERLGFIRERTIPNAEWINDRFVDNTVYSMSRKNWHQQVKND